MSDRKRENELWQIISDHSSIVVDIKDGPLGLPVGKHIVLNRDEFGAAFQLWEVDDDE